MRKSMKIAVAWAVLAILSIATLSICAAVRAGGQGPALAAKTPTTPATSLPSTGQSQVLRSDPNSSDTRPIIFQVHWRPQAQFAGYVMAQEKGFFRQATGREVNLEWYIAGPSPLERLCAGKTDFCTAWLAPAIRERSLGKPIVNIAQIMQRSALMFVARKDSGIRGPADLTGRRVGMWGVDFDVQGNALFAKFAVKPVIVTQDFSITPFLRGAVDVASAMYYNEYHKILEAGLRPEDLNVFLLADYGMDFPEDGIYCTQDTLRKNPDLCAGVAAAAIRGWEYALSHEAETLDVIMKYAMRERISTNRNHQRWMLQAMGKFLRYRVGNDPAAWGSLSPKAYADVAKILTDQGLISRTPPLDEFRPTLSAGRKSP